MHKILLKGSETIELRIFIEDLFPLSKIVKLQKWIWKFFEYKNINLSFYTYKNVELCKKEKLQRER